MHMLYSNNDGEWQGASGGGEAVPREGCNREATLEAVSVLATRARSGLAG